VRVEGIIAQSMYKLCTSIEFRLTPKGPMSVDGFLGSLGRLSRRQKNE
jgi:hypothetical protein